MTGHKICFYGEIWLIIPKFSLLPLLIWSTVNSYFFKGISSASSIYVSHLYGGQYVIERIAAIVDLTLLH